MLIKDKKKMKKFLGMKDVQLQIKNIKIVAALYKKIKINIKILLKLKLMQLSKFFYI